MAILMFLELFIIST